MKYLYSIELITCSEFQGTQLIFGEIFDVSFDDDKQMIDFLLKRFEKRKVERTSNIPYHYEQIISIKRTGKDSADVYLNPKVLQNFWADKLREYKGEYVHINPIHERLKQVYGSMENYFSLGSID